MQQNTNNVKCLNSNIIQTTPPTETEHKIKQNFPFSFVINREQSCINTINLTKDFRRILEPYSATKNGKFNKNDSIHDYIKASKAYNLSRLFIFDKCENELTLKTARLPSGPTLSFKVKAFTLALSISEAYFNNYAYKGVFCTNALRILNNCIDGNTSNFELYEHQKFMVSTFTSMFPTFIPLSPVNRCVVISYDSNTEYYDIRHYVITLDPDIKLKKMYYTNLPNIPNCDDIANFINGKIDFKYKAKGLSECSYRADINEIGPRLTIQLMKIERRVFAGEILYHRKTTKTKKVLIQNSLDIERYIRDINAEDHHSSDVYSDDDSEEELFKGNQRLRKQFVPKYGVKEKPVNKTSLRLHKKK